MFYPYGGGIAKVITEGLPNVEATAEVTAASIDNLKFLKQGTSDLAFTMSDAAQDAVLARDDFKDFGAIPLRTLAVLYSSYTHLVTLADSGITDVAQLKGRTISMGAAGSGTATLGYRILEASGVGANDIRSQSLGVAQSVDALKDGKIDAFFWNGGLPTASVLDLVNTPRIRARFIATDSLLPQLEKTYGPSLYYKAIIPKGMYQQDTDIPVVGVAVLLVVSETMPEDSGARHYPRAVREAAGAGDDPSAGQSAVDQDRHDGIADSLPSRRDSLLPRPAGVDELGHRLAVASHLGPGVRPRWVRALLGRRLRRDALVSDQLSAARPAHHVPESWRVQKDALYDRH